MTKFINDLSKEVYEDNYKAQSDNTVDDSLRRVAKDLAKIEKDPDYWEEKFFEVLADFKTSVGGRILSNAGLGYKSTTYINCFVDGFQGKDQDSMDSIMDALKRQAQILRSEGGYGFCVDILRPTSEFIEGIGNQSPGPVAMLEMWDKQANVITRGGKKKNKKGKKKIRKGAQMVTMSIWHPSIEEFITAKLKTGMLEHFNMSVLITDDFMQAVKKNKPWSLEFPDFHSSKEVKKKYESTWDGNIVKWKKEGLPVKIYKTYEDANELWDLIMESTYNRAEPGVIFIDKANHFNNLHYNEHINATNPCLTADTLVYVADGRGHVTLGELARIGEDVPVFCMDNNGRITVRVMRNPRLTGKNKKILKVTLDDGTVIKGTENHKVRNRDGEWVELKDLKPGTSLSIVTKFQSTIGPKDKASSKNLYWHLNRGYFGGNITEHSLVSEYSNGRKSVKGEHIHHIDFNSLNNSPDNLIIMTAKEHMELHSNRIKGAANPMVRAQTEWSDKKWKAYKNKMSKSTAREKNGRWLACDEEIKKHALILSKKVKGRFSQAEWQKYALENRLPSQFSKGRRKNLGKICELSVWAAKKNGYEVNEELDRKSEIHVRRFEKMGYETKVENKSIYLKKECPCCLNSFWVLPHERERKYCSDTCRRNDYSQSEEAILNIKKIHREEKERKKLIQIEEYLKLKKKNNEISRKDFEKHCKENGLPSRIGNNSPFSNFGELKEAASRYNHKVISVEFYGYEDVYNGTVDEFHNFYIGGNEVLDKAGRQKISYINTKNCGEQLLPVGGVCLLGSVNLVHFVKGNNWDYEKLEELIPIFNRMLDNVNDVTDVPLKSQKDNLKNKRRIGVGYMGYASALMMMKVAYGSKKALKMTDELASFFVNKLYQSSAMLAKEKGAFPLFDKKKYLESNFVKKLWPETIELIKKYGIRNSHLTSIQPTGNTSILCNIVSGGLEPIFAAEYTRTSIVTTPPEGLYIPEVDFAGKSFKLPADVKQVWEWKSEGGDPILVTEFEGTIYKVDISRGLVKESIVRDFAVEYLLEKDEWDASAEWAKGAMSLSVKEHVDTMKVFAKHVDSAMSKTINIPNDYPYEDFKKVYMDCFDSGVIKGCTTYRTGTRTAVLSTSEDKKESLKTDTMKRPEELECDLFQLSAEGKKWFVIVGLLDKRPYEVFSFPVDSMLFTVPTDIKKGKLVKRKVKGKKVYDLHVGKWILPDVISNFETHEQESLTRMTSMTLRHGADVKYVVDQLLKSSGTVVSFNKAIARVLKSYIDDVEGLKCLDCGSDKVQMTEGCITCRDCGSSKCS